MIRHIVLLKARPEVTDAHIAAIFADLHSLNLPGILAIHSGRSAIRFHSFVRFPNDMLGNHIRLCFCHELLLS